MTIALLIIVVLIFLVFVKKGKRMNLVRSSKAGLVAGILLFALLFIIYAMIYGKSEPFHFEVSKNRCKCPPGFKGKPVGFEYSLNDQRALDCKNLKEENMDPTIGRDGFLNKNIMGFGSDCECKKM